MNTSTTVWLSGAQADLLNEGSGYLLGGEAAKGALEEAASGMVLTDYVDKIFDLAERKRGN